MPKRLAVGARELKTRLGSYLRQVRQGRTLTITDRGEPVAELRPIRATGTSLRARLARLHEEGVVTHKADRSLQPFTPIQGRGHRLAEAVSEDREDRF